MARVLRTLSVSDNLQAAAAFMPRKDANEAYDHALSIFPEMALEIADRVAVLSRGRVIAQDGVARFRDDPDAIRNLYIDTEAA